MTRLASYLALFLCFATPYVSATAQSTSTADLHVIALEASLKQMASDWGAIDDGNGGKRVRTDYRNVVVMKDRFTPDGMPAQIGASHVDYLDHDGLVQKAKRLRKPFSILEMVPMVVEGAAVVVTYRVHWVTFSKGRLNLDISDWSKVYFRFDCSNHRFVVDRVDLGGI